MNRRRRSLSINRSLIYAHIFRNIPDQLEIFSYYSGIFYKTLNLLIYNHLIIHIWSLYKNIILFQKIC